MSEFTRGFSFKNLPIFGIDSPWNQPAGEAMRDSERRARTVFDILREESWHLSLADAIKAIVVLDPAILKEIEACQKACQADSGTCDECQAKIVESIGHDRLVTHQGGHLQSPGINFDTYAFPIFETESKSEFLAELPVKDYDGATFLSQALPPELPLKKDPRTQSPAITWKVPVRAKARQTAHASKRMRSAGPTGTDVDGAIILYDPETHSEYDFFQATMQVEGNPPKSTGGGETGNRILHAGGFAFFKTHDGGGPFPDGGVQFVDGLIQRGSGRASGLPYLGGLLVAEDLTIPSGGSVNDITIDHAFAFVLPRLRYVPYPTTGDPPNFVYPASSTETYNHTHNPYALAAGQRIRLKADSEVLKVDGNNYFTSDDSKAVPPITRIFLKAFRKYGAYLVDGGGGFGIAAEDFRTANLKLKRDDLLNLLGFEKDPGFSVVPQEPSEAQTWKLIMEQLNDSLSGFGRFARENRLTFGLGDDVNGYHMNFEVVEDLAVPPA